MIPEAGGVPVLLRFLLLEKYSTDRLVYGGIDKKRVVRFF